MSQTKHLDFLSAATVAVAALGDENRSLHEVSVRVTERRNDGTLHTTVHEWPVKQVNV